MDYVTIFSLSLPRASGVSSSFGAMLLLMAIHFHVQQLSAIIELVSAALGMKVITRASSLGRIKYIFTHDVFTEQVKDSIKRRKLWSTSSRFII